MPELPANKGKRMDRRNFLVGSMTFTAAAATGSLNADSPKKRRKKHRVAIIGCGRFGQIYAEVYRAMPDTELVAIAEWNDERRKIVGKRFGVKALFKDVHGMLREVVPDVAAVVTPTKYMKEAVIACAKAGVKGVSTEKPMAARLSDADEMVEACSKQGVVFSGGSLERARWEVQQVAKRLQKCEFGKPVGAAVHGFGGQISGVGCQHLSILRLFTQAEVCEVTAWGSPSQALDQKADLGLYINGLFRLSSGIACPVFGTEKLSDARRPRRGVDVWTNDVLVRWARGAPQIFRGPDGSARKQIDPRYPVNPWANSLEVSEFLRGRDSVELVSSIRSLLSAVETGSELWISGHDLRQALEIAIACKHSAQLGNQPVKLPLQDRSLLLYPEPERWLGRDGIGLPQSAEEAAGKSS